MTFVHAFQFMGDNAGLLWHKSLEHMAISAVAVAIAMAVALPIGLWLGHLHRGSFLAVNVANIGRALPSLAVLSIGIAFLGVGKANVVLALLVLAIPPVITNAYVAVDSVETDAVGAARVLATALALAVAACGSGGSNSSTAASTSAAPAGKPGAGKPAVTVGAKNFTEQFVLGQLYKQALEAKGFTVKLKNNIGSTEIIDKGLTSGNIDIYPEYIGVGLTAVAHDNKSYPTEQAAYYAFKTCQEGRGFTLLDQTPFTDVDAIAVKPPYAKQHNLKSVADLKNAGSFKIGAPPEFRTRFTGLVGMKKEYGITNATLVPLTIGLQY